MVYKVATGNGVKEFMAIEDLVAHFENLVLKMNRKDVLQIAILQDTFT